MARPTGLALRSWMALAWAAQPWVARHLRGRIAKGKEDPTRWREKLGYPGADRPGGRLVWMHAVGLGEVLALRGLIDALGSRRAELSFLVTSGTLASAQVLAGNLPARTQHQFLPWDGAGPSNRFLDHWRPDLSIWAEQDIWPGLVARADQRGIPLALVNARMNARAYERRARLRALSADALRRFSLISAQNADTARHLELLGAPQVRRDGSLKPMAPPLAAPEPQLAALRAAIGDRSCWVLASSHPEDEALALAAHRARLARDPRSLLILAPRRPDRRDEITEALRAANLTVAIRSADQPPDAQVYLADTFGEMGLWYRLADVAYVGGSNSDVEGHNPWEPLALGCPVLHGSRTANFAADYAELHTAGAARTLTDPQTLADALDPEALTDLRYAGATLSAHRMDRLSDLCDRLVAMIPD